MPFLPEIFGFYDIDHAITRHVIISRPNRLHQSIFRGRFSLSGHENMCFTDLQILSVVGISP